MRPFLLEFHISLLFDWMDQFMYPSPFGLFRSWRKMMEDNLVYGCFLCDVRKCIETDQPKSTMQMVLCILSASSRSLQAYNSWTEWENNFILWSVFVVESIIYMNSPYLFLHNILGSSKVLEISYFDLLLQPLLYLLFSISYNNIILIFNFVYVYLPSHDCTISLIFAQILSKQVLNSRCLTLYKSSFDVLIWWSCIANLLLQLSRSGVEWHFSGFYQILSLVWRLGGPFYFYEFFAF